MFAALADNENAYYGRQLPNLILSPEPPVQQQPNQYQDAVNVYDPYTKKKETNKGDWSSYIQGVDISQDLKNKAAVCQAATSPGDLAGVVNYKDKVRCGWILKKGPAGSPNPVVSQGALGSATGPLSFFPHGQGQWFWNLTDAQKELDKTRCSCLKSCKDIGGADFYGKCGFCNGRGIPINSDGSAKYPKDNRLNCTSGSIIRDVGSCPPPPPPGSPAARAASQDVCSMNSSGQISRNCLLDRLMAAGCSDNGSLAVALHNGATPNNYAQSLESVPAFAKYQLFATTPLNTDILKQGKGSAQVALSVFQGLAKDSKTIDEQTALGASSRDLCVKKGTFDTYDFCTELNDASRAPFALECLQKEFRRQGGQPAGSLYPINTAQGNPLQAQLAAVNADLKYLTGIGLGPGSGNATFDDRYAKQKMLTAQINAGNTFNYWNTTYNTWGDLREAFAQLAKSTQSTDQSVQTLALKQFLGIAREQAALAQIDPKNGFEIFFFPYPGFGNDANLTFLGRRVLGSDDFPTLNRQTTTKFQTGFDQMHFAIITNLRPNQDESNIAFQVTTDDGTALAVNVDIDPIKTNVTSASYFSRFFNQATTQYQNVCTQLTAGGPNYVTIRYYDGGGQASFKLQFKNCSSGAVTPIPSYMFTLTQEPAAPYASFEVMSRSDAFFFEELRLGRGMFAGTSGGNGSSTILENNKIGPLIPFNIGINANWQTKMRLAFQCLRTISIVWSAQNAAAAASTMFFWLDKSTGNGLKIVLTGQQLSATWSSGSGKIQGSLPVPISANTPYYMRITFEAANTLLPSVIRISIIPLSVSDTTQLDMDTNQIVLNGANGVLFSRYIQSSSMAGYMGFGAAPAEQTSPVGLLIGFLHIFDYVVDSHKAQIDISGQWKRKFIY